MTERVLRCGLILLFVLFTRSAWARDPEPQQAPAQKRERVAVLILAANDRALSDNLTEVAISALAGSSEWDFIGLSELRGTLTQLEPIKREGMAACFENMDCRKQVALATGAQRAIFGRVHAAAEGYSIALTLTETQSTAPERTLQDTALNAMNPLIVAVQLGVRELTRARDMPKEEAANAFPGSSGPGASPPGATPRPVLGDSAPGPVAASPGAPVRWSSRSLSPLAPSTRDRRKDHGSVSTARYLAYGAATLAILSFGGAAIARSIAGGPPRGDTRAEVQTDFDRRSNYQKVAVGLLASGGVFATVTVVSVIFD